MGDPIEHPEPVLSFGEWVRSRRLSRGLTQAMLARLVPCAVVSIRKIESDERRPSQDMAVALAVALALEPAERELFVDVARGVKSAVRLLPLNDRMTSKDPGDVRQLPAPPNRLIGRTDELDRVFGLFAERGGPARLVTLTGAPGVGKSRLALEVASITQRGAPNVAVFYVELTTAFGDAGLRDRISAAVTSTPTGYDQFEHVKARLRAGPTLLVLDGFEHLLSHASVVAALLASAPLLTCLVTSRVRLDLSGEFEFRVDPLPTTTVGDSATAPAVELFLERALAVRADVDVHDRRETVVALCRALDGLPLAIELAARQLRGLTVDDLLSQVTMHAGVLGTGPRDADPRHRTMTSAVEWSLSLLGATAQRVFRAMSVAVGPAAPGLVGATADLDEDAARDALAEIAEHGLGRIERERATMFEVVRSVGRARLVDHGEQSSAERRFAAHLFAGIDQTSKDVVRLASRAELVSIEADYPNLLHAIEWSLGHGDAEAARRAVVRLLPYWYGRGEWTEGRAWARRAYESTAMAVERAGPAMVEALLAWQSGEKDLTALRLTEAVAGGRQAGDDAIVAPALGLQGTLAMLSGRYDLARALLVESFERSSAAGLHNGLALAHLRLGHLAMVVGDMPGLERETRRSLDLFEQIGDAWGVGNATGNLAEAASWAGDHVRALGLRVRAVEVLWETGYEWYTATALGHVANVLAQSGRQEDAARVYGIVDAWLEELGAPMFPVHADAYAKHRELVRTALGTAFETALRDARKMPRSIALVTSLAELRQADDFLGSIVR